MTVLEQLPPPPVVFVDRDPLLAAMSARVTAAWDAGRPAFLAVHGASGVGVRSAVHQWYARVSEWFPDGAVRVPLAGADGEALLTEALADVLSALGVDRDQLPASGAARTNLLRSLTHDKRLLLVLEEVTNQAQVDPFLLNSPGSAVVVVSRSWLRRLASMGFEPLPVEPLAERFGVELFERVLGSDWCGEARVAPESVARVCGGYPLAIHATAAQIASTPEWEAADLIRDLAARGLGALDPESQDHVRDSFDLAYRRLSPPQARAYRLAAGLYPGSAVFTDAAAVLLAESPGETRNLLTALVSAQLLTRDGADSFARHDIAHWHARDRAEAEEPFAEQQAAVARVAHWYLAQTVRRDRALSDRPRLGPAYQVPEPDPVTREDALAWLERRRGNLRAVIALAERFQLPDVVWQLCEALWGVYHLHGHYEEWITTHRSGVEAAIQLGDPRVRMRMTSQLGAALRGSGDLAEAERRFTSSHEAAIEAGHPVGAQSALEWLGKIAAERGDFPRALDFFDRSWAVVAEVPEKNRPRMYALLWLQRARTLLAMNDLDGARQAGEHAVAHFSGGGEGDNLAKSLLVVARATADAELARRAAELFRRDRSTRAEADALRFIVSLDPEDAAAERLRELVDGDGDVPDPQ